MSAGGIGNDLKWPIKSKKQTAEETKLWRGGGANIDVEEPKIDFLLNRRTLFNFQILSKGASHTWTLEGSSTKNTPKTDLGGPGTV